MKIISIILCVIFYSQLSAANICNEPLPNDPKELYINLMKKILANTIYEDPCYPRLMINQKQGAYNPQDRENGRDHPISAHTMVGMKRLHNIHYCLKDILLNEIPGDCIETGVWRGGCTILMRAILKAYGDTTRKVWIADSFEGVPPPNPTRYPKDQNLNLCSIPYLAVSMEEVQNNFRKYGLLDDQCIFLKGWFRDTLSSAPIEKLALLRLDGDLYESTIQALDALYPKLSIGGYVIIDDFGIIPACARAVIDYRQAHGIDETIVPIDLEGIYWQKNH